MIHKKAFSVLLLLLTLIKIINAADWQCKVNDPRGKCKCWTEKNVKCNNFSDCSSYFGYDRCCRFGSCIMASTFNSWNDACWINEKDCK